MNGRRLWAVMLKELRQMRRDRITLAMIGMIPVMQLLLFGYAINTNLRDLPAGIVDQAGTSASRALAMDIVASTVVAPVRFERTPQQAMDAIRRGEYGIGIVIPADFERRRADGREQVQILVDGSDNAVQAAAGQLVRMPLEDVVRTASPATRALAAPPVAVLPLFNPERRSAVNTHSASTSGHSSHRLAPRSMIPRTRRRKCVSGSTSANHCTATGMPAKGNMKPDSRIEGRNTKNVTCIAWNCDLAAVEISRPRARLATISSEAAR